MGENLQITSIETLQEYARGQVVQLPDFADGQPFVARISRPSMMSLAKQGKIPNELLATANELFCDSKMSSKNQTVLSDVFTVLDVVCEACFIEPTYQQIKDAGIDLTDEQYMFVFQYSQSGVRALEPFRQKT